MNILYIGAGFVGACSAAVAGNSGHDTLVFDVDKRRIDMLGSGDRDTVEECLFERGLGDLLVQHQDRIRFTSDYADAIKFLDACDAVFLCLPTPEIGETGESDLSYYKNAAATLAVALKNRNSGTQSKYMVAVNKSTVPIGTAEWLRNFFVEQGVLNVGVVSNPEFLVEGKAIQDSLKPNRIVVGASTEADKQAMQQIYQRFFQDTALRYIEVKPEEAEAGKLLANFYLFAKLALCFDVIGRVGETFSEIRFESLRTILTSDERIGNWGFYDSLYAGGSCLIKDARSLSHQLQTAGQGATIVNEVHDANRRQLELFLGRASSEAKREWKDAKVAILGLAFKRDTNDVRNSPSLTIVNVLREQHARSVVLFDPAAMDSMKRVVASDDFVTYAQTEKDAMNGADVIILATDWPQFRGVADDLLAAPRPGVLIMDGRRLLTHRYADLQAAGYDILAVGGHYLPGKKYG